MKEKMFAVGGFIGVLLIGVVIGGLVDSYLGSSVDKTSYTDVNDYGIKALRIYYNCASDEILVKCPESIRGGIFLSLKEYLSEIKLLEGKSESKVRKAKILQAVDWYDEKVTDKKWLE